MEDITLSNAEDPSEEKYAAKQPSRQPKHFWNRIVILLLIISIVAGFLGTNIQEHQDSLQISQQEQATQLQIADEQEQETLLQNYMKNITDFMIQDQLLKKHAAADPAKIAADAMTRATLSHLNSTRRAQLMTFLYQTKLLSNDSVSLNMQDVDISHSQMAAINLEDTDLLGANMSGSDMHGAALNDALLIFTNLSHTNLAQANLHACDMHNTNITGANLAGANLRDVVGLTDAQINSAQSLKGATMPDGTVHP
jgi:uncharacterized protein YjbI with pentapeptide repeats